MIIKQFEIDKKNYFNQSTALLADNFACWADIEEAEKEIIECNAEGNILLVAVEEDNVVGLIGGRSQYDGNVWELHPLVVNEKMRCKGIGKMLVEALEAEAAKKGGITIYLGTDDEYNATSLSGVNIYENIYDKLKNIKNHNNHAFEFYQKCGYVIVGVVPDANGVGKPDIMMAKRVKNVSA